MKEPKKIIEIVAGPNGSGKTTFAEAYFKLRNGSSRFINPDIIAAGLSFGNESQAAFHAGRVLLATVEECVQAQLSFSFESTLSGKTWLPILRKAKSQGYQFVIYFLYLKDSNMNLERIKKRVEQGGHSVSSVDVRRRHPRCFHNFWDLYRPICSDWFVLDNSGTSPKQVHSMSSFSRLNEEAQKEFVKDFLKGGRVK